MLPGCVSLLSNYARSLGIMRPFGFCSRTHNIYYVKSIGYELFRTWTNDGQPPPAGFDGGCGYLYTPTYHWPLINLGT